MTLSKWVSSLYVPQIYIMVVLATAAFLFTLDQPIYAIIRSNNLQTTPLGNSAAGQIGYASIYLLMSIVAVFGLAAVVVRKRFNDRKWAAIAILFYLVLVLLDQVVFWYIPWMIMVLVTMVFAALFIGSVEGHLPRITGVPFVILFTTSVGIILVLTTPPITLLALPIAYSIWDIYAVFKGPMLKLAKGLPPKTRSMFILNVGSRGIGFGDLMFYSLVVCMGLTYSILGGALAAGGIVWGVGLTFNMLRQGKHKALPGLPIPILLGYVGIGLSFLL